MLRRMVAARGFVSALGVLLAAVVVAAGVMVLEKPLQRRIEYCAQMPDAVGLYVGNAVTERGVAVGTVTGISADGTRVRVNFRVDAGHPLRGRASAATISDTLVADRHLAVLGSGGPTWDPATCITDTATPKSISQTMDAMARVADQLTSGAPGRIGAAVTDLNTATQGLGPEMNDVVVRLAGALRSPDASIEHLGRLIDSTGQLMHSIAGGWGDLRQMLQGFAPVLTLINGIWDQVVELVHSIVVILPWFNDVTSKYGGSILELLDTTVPTLDLLAANIGSLQQLVRMVPTVTAAFRAVIDPATGRLAVTYASPRIALPPTDAAQLCSAVAALVPRGCAGAEHGVPMIDLATLVADMGGMR